MILMASRIVSSASLYISMWHDMGEDIMHECTFCAVTENDVMHNLFMSLMSL